MLLKEGQHWRHSGGEIVIIRLYCSYNCKMMTIDQLHSSTGTGWIRSEIEERALKNYFWLVGAKLVVSSNEIWKELCLK